MRVVADTTDYTIPQDDEDTFTGDEPKSSAGILAQIDKAEDAFRDWQTTCSTIDRIYNLDGYAYDGISDTPAWNDAKLDLFWASFEVLKPAVYARPPQPVVAPLFKDNRQLPSTTAELLERCAISSLQRTNINDVMMHCRDDMLFAGRGVQWSTYEADKDGKRVCVEHVDRKDFLHEPTRKWEECGWVAKRSWLTRKEMRKRFYKTSGDVYKDATYVTDQERNGDRSIEQKATAKRAGVWEVWHRADNRVYWVAPGCEKRLDDDKPHLELSNFFPCPRPGYATLRRRSLIPVPDYSRYRQHLSKISELTGRIYVLLESVKMRGLVAGGSDIGEAVKQMLRSEDDEIVIEVPSAAMNGLDGAVVWLPLKELAEAIQGLIAARGQLIEDFYQLSGIADIMRGASEENETLGAQQLKSQYGSVRVREKSAELQRLAADTVRIICEIIAQKFDKQTLLDMCQMEIPSKAELEKQVREIEKAAKGEMEALGKKAQEAAKQAQMQAQQSGEPVNQQQAMEMLQQAQQQIVQKYAPALARIEQSVPIEDVMELLRDDKARAFTFEIESSSTVLVDEMQEKASVNEFMAVLTDSMAKISSAIQLGEAGIKLWGEATKFQLSRYRAGRTMEAAVDEFIDQAPEIAARMAAQAGDDSDTEGLAAAQKALAAAEQTKADAAMANVQAKAQLDKAENQRKMAELQQRAMNDAQKAQEANQKLQLQMADMGEKHSQAMKKLTADMDLTRAKTLEIINKINLANKQQTIDEFESISDIELRQNDQSMAAQGMEQDAQFRSAEHERADRGEERADRQQDFSEQAGDRQMTLAEQQAMREGQGNGNR